MKALIAFYSRAGENYFGGAYRRISVGNTEQAARMLAAVTGADTLRIEQVQPYSEDYKACVAEAREDWQCGARPALVNLPESLDGYDEIYLGYPNYCGTMPMAVYTFLEHHQARKGAEEESLQAGDLHRSARLPRSDGKGLTASKRASPFLMRWIPPHVNSL